MASQPWWAAVPATYSGSEWRSGSGKGSAFHSVTVSGLPTTWAAASQSIMPSLVNGFFSSWPLAPYAWASMTSPAVSAGSALRPLPPQVLVVAIGTFTPRPRRWLIMSALKRCSRSLRNSFEGPCSQARQVRSVGRSYCLAKALAASM
ncbi:hypothetical protein D3C85_1325000 [compost metagenome]